MSTPTRPDPTGNPYPPGSPGNPDPPQPAALVAGNRVKVLGGGRQYTFTVSSSEEHEGLTFYRLEEIDGGLFLRRSLELEEDAGKAAAEGK